MIGLLLLACAAESDPPLEGIEIPTLAREKSRTPTTYAYCGGDAVRVLDLTLPVSPPGPTSSDPVPVVLLVHGGGWTHGSRTDPSILLPVRDLLSAGFATAAVDYRPVDGSTVLLDDQLDDLRCAIDYLITEAVHLGLDPTRILLLGASAGGLDAALVSEGLDGLVLWYSPTDLTGSFAGLSGRTTRMLFGTRSPPDAVLVAASPIYSITPPPTLLMHGTADTVVPVEQSEAAAATWGADLILVDGAGHGWSGAADRGAIVDETVAWVIDHG